MKFKEIESLSITECCELLNIKRQDLPNALQNLNCTSELEQSVADRLTNLLATEELLFYKNCKGRISGCKAYLEKYPKGKFVKEIEYILGSKIKKRRRRNIMLFVILATIVAVICLENYHPASYLFTDDIVSFDKKGEKRTFFIETDADGMNIDVIENSEWISIEREFVYGNPAIIAVDQNFEGERSAIITIEVYSSFFGKRYGYISKRITINQRSGLATYLNTNTSEITFDKYGNPVGNDVIITETDGYDIQISSNQSWYTFSKDTIFDGNKTTVCLQLNTNMNKTGKQIGEIIISCNDLIKRIKVVQESGLPTFLDVSCSEIRIDKYGKTSVEQIMAETDGCDLQISTNDTWFAFVEKVKPKGGNMVASISLIAETNDGESKTGEILVNCNQFSKRIKIVQDSGAAKFFELDYSNIHIPEKGPGEGKCYRINVQTDGTSWSVKSSPSWLTVRKYESHIDVFAEANVGKIKTGKIILMSNNGNLKHVEVSQEGDPTNFGASLKKINFGTSSDYKYITISNNSHKGLSINEYESWISTSVINKNEIKISCSKNNDSPRGGTVYVCCGDEEISIKVGQKGWETCSNCRGNKTIGCTNSNAQWRYYPMTGANLHQVWGTIGQYWDPFMGQWTPQFGWINCNTCEGHGTIRCATCDGKGEIEQSYW